MSNFLLSIITLFLYLLLKYRKSFYALQQNSYNQNYHYIKWVFKNPRKTFITYELLFAAIAIGIYFLTKKVILLTLIFYFLSFILELFKIKKEQHKKKFVFTKRVFRLTCTTIVILGLILTFMIIYFNEDYVMYYYLILFLYGYLSFIITVLINFINKPMEKIVYLYYKNKAVTKLNSINGLKVIGITGSYGKTSSKNILNGILQTSFNCYPSPKSFNTPYGLMNAINNGLDKFDEIFIAEMGAVRKGDIKVLTDLVHPKYGIITTIGVAHLETFKSEENILNGKFELIESLPSDGVGVLNMDDPKQVSYKIKNNCKIIWIGIDNKDADYVAENIKLSGNGTSFDVKIKDKIYNFNTVLLGRHNIYNILASIALGIELGVDPSKLELAIKSLKPIEHRLELKKNGNINIIDDAFNSNPVGSKRALEVLSYMDGKKIIVTPGMIELGPKEYEYNFKFGEYISEVCDEVILIGEKQTKPIYDGLINKGYDKNKIHILNDVRKAFPLINELKGEYVLLENDLPDIFSEV